MIHGDTRAREIESGLPRYLTHRAGALVHVGSRFDRKFRKRSVLSVRETFALASEGPHEGFSRWLKWLVNVN